METKEMIEPVFRFWSRIFGVISDKTRLLILLALYDSEVTKKEGSHSLSFSKLREITGLQKSSLEYHLKVLRMMELITNEKRQPYTITREGLGVLASLGITEHLLKEYQRHVEIR